MIVDARIHGRPRLGESCSGDAGKVRATSDGAWVLLVDALGHGPKAAEAAALALDEFDRFDAQLSVEDGLLRLHQRLRGSRGAAAVLAWFDARGVTVGGVGNVELRSLGERPLPFVPANGVLGGRMRRPRSTQIDLEPGDRMLLHTDGIARRTPFAQLAALEPAALCEALIDQHSHAHDDATLIHLTYLGDRAESP